MLNFKFVCSLLFVCYFVSLQLSAQSTDNPLEGQFTEMVNSSNRYQVNRVIPIRKLDAFKGNLVDSLEAYQAKFAELNSEIADQKKTIEGNIATIEARDAEIVRLNEEKDGISLLGTNMSKTAYSSLLWGIIGVLLAGLLFFLARGRYAVSMSNQLEKSNKELTEELEKSRKQRLKVEQDLRRKLQDEINKRS